MNANIPYKLLLIIFLSFSATAFYSQDIDDDLLAINDVNNETFIYKSSTSKQKETKKIALIDSSFNKISNLDTNTLSVNSSILSNYMINDSKKNIQFNTPEPALYLVRKGYFNKFILARSKKLIIKL